MTVSGSPVVYGDFTDDGTITDADWAIFRANQHADLSGNTFAEAYFRGDLNVDKANNHADFVAFKVLYEAANGPGSFAAMLAGVPEPSSLVLIVSALLLAFPVRRRAAHRA